VGWWPFRDRPPPIRLSAAHAFGHLPPAPPGEQPLPIRYAGAIAPDPAQTIPYNYLLFSVSRFTEEAAPSKERARPPRKRRQKEQKDKRTE
jgi:hypothetical protein